MPYHEAIPLPLPPIGTRSRNTKFPPNVVFLASGKYMLNDVRMPEYVMCARLVSVIDLGSIALSMKPSSFQYR